MRPRQEWQRCDIKIAATTPYEELLAEIIGDPRVSANRFYGFAFVRGLPVV